MELQRDIFKKNKTFTWILKNFVRENNIINQCWWKFGTRRLLWSSGFSDLNDFFSRILGDSGIKMFIIFYIISAENNMKIFKLFPLYTTLYLRMEDLSRDARIGTWNPTFHTLLACQPVNLHNGFHIRSHDSNILGFRHNNQDTKLWLNNSLLISFCYISL